MNIGDLARSAEVVIHGRVIRHWAGWDASHRYIWTHYVVQVQDRFKGNTAGETIASEPGGVVNDIGMKIEGVPEYQDGDEVVAFLHRTPIGYWRSYGLAQGRFKVVQDAAGEKRVRTDLSGIKRVDIRKGLEPNSRTAAMSLEAVDGMSLAQFKQLIAQEALRP